MPGGPGRRESKGGPQNSHGEGTPGGGKRLGRAELSQGTLASEGSAWPLAEPPGTAHPWGHRLADVTLKAKSGAQEALRGMGTVLTKPGEWKATFLPKPLCTGPIG